MKKLYTLALLISLSSLIFAQNYKMGKSGDDNYRYLDGYDALKEYIDYSKYPNFKLGAGTTVGDYLNSSTYRAMINDNFTETVAGNAMKMSSCVDGNGNMNFNTVKSYVNTATAAGLSVYGHTLAWHSQQAKGWLLKLLADKPDPEAGEVFAVVTSKDFRTTQSVGWKANESENGYTMKFDATNGLKVTTTVSTSAVGCYGLDERLLVFELLFLPDFANDGKREAFSIQITVQVENVDFVGQLMQSHRGSRAHVKHPLVAFFIHHYPNGIHSLVDD